MTRYVEAFTWTPTITRFLDEIIRERPMLEVCSGPNRFGDTTIDLYELADVRADWTSLPIASNSYEAVFADPPWNSGYKTAVSRFVKEALRVAPVAYLMAPWIYGGKTAHLTNVCVRHFPGVNTAILITRYERGA